MSGKYGYKAIKETLIKNVDYILIVNKNFDIIYNSRWDANMGNGKEAFNYGNKKEHLFEKYPTLGRENSTIARTMATGEVIISDAQEFSDDKGRVYLTQNMTLPIFKDGKIIGVVELTKELTNLEHINSKDDYFRRLAMENSFKPNRENNEQITFEDIITLDEEMLRIIEHAKIFSTQMTPTLIYGETGTGKELFAQAMINYSADSDQKIIVQNCAAVPDNLIESILFGTTKGSFTGAENKKGLFEEADEGILFLDELNALPYEVQGKFLRVIQDGSFRPIGSNKEKKVKVKIIAAMNIDPMEAIKSNILRKDLFYRLSGNMIYLPPLRERKKDIEYLINYYIGVYNESYQKNVEGITENLREVFLNYLWDGNVRELKHVIESMVSMTNNKLLDVNEIPIYLHNKLKGESVSEDVLRDEEKMPCEALKELEIEEELISDLKNREYNLKSALENIEKKIVKETLKKVNGNKTKASEILGIPRQTLNYKLSKWNISETEISEII